MDFHAAKQYLLAKLEEELPKKYSYHGKHHTLDVLQATEALCQAEGINAEETLLLRTAALFHDAGFLIHPEEHEKHGCAMARQELPKYGYALTQIEKICQLILATDLNHAPQNHLEYILRDADLDYLGRNDYFPIAESLYQELLARGMKLTREEWNNIQVLFLENHQFFTPSSIANRQATKEAHLATIKKSIV